VDDDDFGYLWPGDYGDRDDDPFFLIFGAG
jgi:hypothetical protein